MRDTMAAGLKLYEPAEFIFDFLLDRLTFHRQAGPIAVHHTCSSVKMGLEAKMTAIAERCAPEVVVPDQITCCGFAGDRGFNFPELNASALETLAPAVARCSAGYSTSRTCEIGLSLHSGIFYKSIVYLVDSCTEIS
jgi:D-lactate dehydrogenase